MKGNREEKPVGDIPRGIEVLVKKASVDSAFKELLLRKRADAAKEIDLELEPSEIAMINAVPESQLESIISKTIVFPKQRKAFLGRVAALMIVALGASTFGCGSEEESDSAERVLREIDGIRPDRPVREEKEEIIGIHPYGLRPDRVRNMMSSRRELLESSEESPGSTEKEEINPLRTGPYERSDEEREE